MQPVLIEKAPASIMIKLSANPFQLPKEIRNHHDHFWNEQINNNPTLRNGEVFTITESKQTPEKLEITVARTDYKHYLYTMQHPACDHPCKVIYSCASILTKDNYMAFGRMSQTTSTPGRLQFAGGGLEERDVRDSIFEMEENMKRELQEEMGVLVHSPSTRSFLPKFIKRKGSHDFWAVIYELTMDYTANELHDHFLHHNQSIRESGKQPEFDQLLLVPLEKEAVQSFIQKEQASMVDYLTPILKKYTEGN
ncbi:8-oxo-dGTP pyrophosphatase MutT (NUDIX family) [Cytobacillus eiseniae]|uniref:8-oxo-dGTP pyrophosphatase MutT (NUDIX family) n=1 Tax=Cytobacillus eiseniae TaxID=762947 RepID=A0ABS4RHJ4_9BACI|nr:NUDIX hydrolase [Cytobacillus eiseniae]MBP2242382.1 8-oxo-dGTP pyrophosphatase MutT (NUDIX family) [Cytobacillus eiseniae]